MKKVLCTFAIIAEFVFSSNSFAADCHIDHFSFNFGTDTSTHMSTKGGTSCGKTMHINGGVTSLVIAQPPQSGSATVSNNNHWEYRAKSGYSGKDAFIVKITGEFMSQKRNYIHNGDTKIIVDVDVTP